MNIYCAGCTEAARFAANKLHATGFHLLSKPDPTAELLLLDIPSFGPDGQLRCGGSLAELLKHFSPEVTVCGGNLNHPALAGYHVIDLLKDPEYLAENAYITAEAALDVALPDLSVTLRNCPVLILGWGRIGKCLGQLLKNIGAEVTIAARKESDRAMIRALGFRAADFPALPRLLHSYRLIYNTVPEILLNAELMTNCRPDCLKIELASRPGMEGDGIITARGLPAIHFPESTGKLIADTLIRLTQKEESS